MSTRYLLDTNVLVYVHDGGNARRRRAAVRLLERLSAEGNAALPVQCLSELSSVALGKLDPPLDPETLYAQIDALVRAFPVLPLTPAVVLEAVRAVGDHQLPYYEAQIWACAKLAQIPVVLSEDFGDGARIEGVAFANPFREGFELG